MDSTVALIQALIPLGLKAVAEALTAEVAALAGERYSRTGGLPGVVRWCQQRGSVYLADQKLPITYRRVRDLPGNREVPLVTYQRLQQPRQADRGVLLKVLRGLSCRAYAECAEAVPAAFGLSPSTIPRRFIRASARAGHVAAPGMIPCVNTDDDMARTHSPPSQALEALIKYPTLTLRRA